MTQYNVTTFNADTGRVIARETFDTLAEAIEYRDNNYSDSTSGTQMAIYAIDEDGRSRKLEWALT